MVNRAGSQTYEISSAHSCILSRRVGGLLGFLDRILFRLFLIHPCSLPLGERLRRYRRQILSQFVTLEINGYS